MYKKCPNCRLVNYPDAVACARCEGDLVVTTSSAPGRQGLGRRIITRAIICFLVCIAAVLAFYLSLVASATPLTVEQKHKVRNGIRLLREKGFDREAMLLDNLTVFRSNDNWLNASVAKENAYAATNFPFEIVTLYSDFFTYPVDDVERAAILLHEAKHLEGKDEAEAYEFVWNNRRQLGWTIERYARSPVWTNTRRLTAEHVPHLFVCSDNEFRDCTEDLRP